MKIVGIYLTNSQLLRLRAIALALRIPIRILIREDKHTLVPSDEN